VTTEGLRAAAERLRRVFHEDEISPLDCELSEEQNEQIRADILSLATERPADELTELRAQRDVLRAALVECIEAIDREVGHLMSCDCPLCRAALAAKAALTIGKGLPK
jgi:galactose-1-phosphate uridylyltransferase